MAGWNTVVFDVDGRLLESNDAHARVYIKALRKHGVTADAVHVRRLIGMGSDNLLPELAGVADDSALGQSIARRKKAIFDEFLPGLQPTTGARAFVQYLRDAGVTLVIATSAGGMNCTRDGPASPRSRCDAVASGRTIRSGTHSRSSTIQFERYKRAGDFVGMDMARKFLQMGYTRARRYANHSSGRKYDALGRVVPLQPDAVKAESAAIFRAAWQRVEADAAYRKLRDEHKLRFG